MIWSFQEKLTQRLLVWSGASVVTGAVLLAAGAPFWRGFGLQAAVWGLIDAAIAVGGRAAARKRRARLAGDSTLEQREAPKLRRLLWINTGLDVAYVGGGVALLTTLCRSDPFAAGNGWGIIVQGGFLFIFDLVHALLTPRAAVKAS